MPSASTPSTRRSPLDDRYGRPDPVRRRRVAVALVAVVAAAGLSWLAWVILVHGRPLAQGDLVAYDVSEAHRAEATFTVVRRSTEIEATCLLRALARDHAIVGEREVPVGADQPERATLTQSVRTERPATSVEMVGCRADGQPRRR